MCGIGGFVAALKLDRGESALNAMKIRLRHRGPDGEGVWVSNDGRAGLCHTRLAILDLSSAGAQPMLSHDGECVLTFNGEIYNWRTIRAELTAGGWQFRTQCDSEVLLTAWCAWGEAMLSRLRGMFAFAIYNKKRRELFCARDRIGKKPFVYAAGQNGFVFSSEIPAIMPFVAAIGADTSPDHGAIATMLLHNLRHIPDPATAYKGLRRLNAGHAMLVKDGRIHKIWRYWDVAAEIAEAKTLAQVGKEAVRAVLEEAVELRRTADVPVGSLLSGGTDSTAITALVQSRSNAPVHTYAFGLDRDDEDLRRAREMAERLGTFHREFYFDASEHWSIFTKLIASYGEPIMCFPLLYAYQLCRAIRSDGLKVVLAGHGADEIFYGYDGHFNTARLSQGIRFLEKISTPFQIVPGYLRPRAMTAALATRGDRKAALYRSYAKDLWSNLKTSAHECVSTELSKWGSVGPHDNYIDESNFVSLLVENCHSVTIAADLPAMLSGIEVRAPFLDQQMVALAFALPWQTKIPFGNDSARLKAILKQSVDDLVPAEFLYAPKRGFGYGIDASRLLLGAWREKVDQVIRSMAPDHWLNREWVRSVWSRMQGGATAEASLFGRMFSILTWEQALS